MRDVTRAARAVVVGLALLAVLASTAAAASPKLSDRDGNRSPQQTWLPGWR